MAKSYVVKYVSRKCILQKGHHGDCEYNQYDPLPYNACRRRLLFDEDNQRWITVATAFV